MILSGDLSVACGTSQESVALVSRSVGSASHPTLIVKFVKAQPSTGNHKYYATLSIPHWIGIERLSSLCLINYLVLYHFKSWKAMMYEFIGKIISSPKN